MRRTLKTAAAALLLAGCTTPYRPPVVVAGSASFSGINAVIGQGGTDPVDVILVHGMCTRTPAWAHAAVNTIMGALVPGYVAPPTPPDPAADGEAIQFVQRAETVRGVPLRFTGLIWSPLTAALKHQLDFDHTGTPTDCAAAGECRPRRARFNGQVKDKLLDDCLADALIYEGDSRPTIRTKMMAALDTTITRQQGGPLVLVTESLGSKLTFDALNAMLEQQAPGSQVRSAQAAAARLVQVFMLANQLPILGLADQVAGGQQSARLLPPADALQRFLTLRGSFARPAQRRIGELTLVALTDPNDLLSYRLLPSRYASAGVHVADVLVSNRPTYFGLLENPVTAHTGYLDNPDVTAVIACGSADRAHCQ